MSQSIPTNQFLTIAINLLHRHFIASSRTQSKRLYRDVQEGRIVPLTAVKMEDESTLRFSLSLDHSEFAGHLNFGAFRGGLCVLLGNISRALQHKDKVTVFSQEKAGSVLFGVTGVTVEGGRTSVMVLGADVEGQAGAVTLRLMYLDPAQFDGPAQTTEPGQTSP